MENVDMFQLENSGQMTKFQNGLEIWFFYELNQLVDLDLSTGLSHPGPGPRFSGIKKYFWCLEIFLCCSSGFSN